MKHITRRFFLYVRKSTDDNKRQLRSIPDQLAEIRELAARENIEIVEVFIEKRTAKKPGRPVFNEMLDRVEKGEADGILAWHPDRLARNSLDGGRIIYLLDIGTLKDVKFCTFWFENTPQGKLMLAFAFGMSKYYVDQLGEGIRRGHERKIKSGIWPQFAPLGYLNDHATKTIVVDPDKSPLVRKAFELYATGNYTLARVRETINAMGLRGRFNGQLAVSNFQYLLKNPVYYGVIRFKDELFEAKHPPIITKELFDKVQTVMADKSKPKTPTLKPYLYRGMFRCGECGCFITAETQKGHNYLHCTKRVKRDCSQPFVREERIVEQVAQSVRDFALPAEWADWMVGELEREQREETDGNAVTVRAVHDDIKATEAKLERLMTAFVEEALSLDEYRQAKNQLVERKQELVAKLTRAEESPAKRFEPVIRFVKAAKQALFLANDADVVEQRDFLKTNGSNLKITNRKVTLVPRGAWELVVDYGRMAQPELARPESDARVVGKSDQISTQRRDRDSNPRYGFDSV